MTPKPYLSYSQMAVFERNPEEYADRYLFGEKQRISRNMALGSELAEGLEAGEATGNPLLDLVAARLPKYELMDKPLEAELKDKKGTIRLLAKPDSAKADYSAFYEYKTSTRKWTQKMVDESGQISFYATAIWLKTGKIPQDIKLICAETAYDEQGRVYATGEMWTIPTKRTLADIIKMTARIRRAWRGIEALCDKELI